MNFQNITLLYFGYFETDILNKLVKYIEKDFLFKVKIIEAHLDISEFFDPTRLQYNANEILSRVDSIYEFGNRKVIGIFNVDFYIPIFTYIFGQAYLNGKTGIVSMYRLSNERYGIESNTDLLIERLSKEIIHEFGHTLGLIHCHIADCVMRSGSYVEDIDQKKAKFCTSCQKFIDDL